MSYNLAGTPVPPYSQDGPSKPTPEERKGLLSNFDVDDRDSGEPPRYEDEEYNEPRERIPLRKRRIGCIAGGLIALILGASFLVPVSRIWCGGMGTTSRTTDPSKLLSNGTHEFKRTVLIVSIDGLRLVPHRSREPFGCSYRTTPVERTTSIEGSPPTCWISANRVSGRSS